jgi:hypothetical protein
VVGGEGGWLFLTARRHRRHRPKGMSVLLYFFYLFNLFKNLSVFDPYDINNNKKNHNKKIKIPLT